MYEIIKGFFKALPELVKLINRIADGIEKLIKEVKFNNECRKIDLDIKKAKNEGITEDISNRINNLFR